MPLTFQTVPIVLKNPWYRSSVRTWTFVCSDILRQSMYTAVEMNIDLDHVKWVCGERRDRARCRGRHAVCQRGLRARLGWDYTC